MFFSILDHLLTGVSSLLLAHGFIDNCVCSSKMKCWFGTEIRLVCIFDLFKIIELLRAFYAKYCVQPFVYSILVAFSSDEY